MGIEHVHVRIEAGYCFFTKYILLARRIMISLVSTVQLCMWY